MCKVERSIIRTRYNCRKLVVIVIVIVIVASVLADLVVDAITPAAHITPEPINGGAPPALAQRLRQPAQFSGNAFHGHGPMGCGGVTS